MTTVLVPEEAANHLGAMLIAFNRQIFGSFLDEAEELAQIGQPASAVLIAGTVLEYFVKSPSAAVLTPQERSQIAEWRELRNQVAHGSVDAVTVGQARQVVDGLRQILATASVPNSSGHRIPASFVKGRYSGVRIDSTDFIGRKRDEIDLEDGK